MRPLAFLVSFICVVIAFHAGSAAAKEPTVKEVVAAIAESTKFKGFMRYLAVCGKPAGHADRMSFENAYAHLSVALSKTLPLPRGYANTQEAISGIKEIYLADRAAMFMTFLDDALVSKAVFKIGLTWHKELKLFKDYPKLLQHFDYDAVIEMREVEDPKKRREFLSVEYGMQHATDRDRADAWFLLSIFAELHEHGKEEGHDLVANVSGMLERIAEDVNTQVARIDAGDQLRDVRR